MVSIRTLTLLLTLLSCQSEICGSLKILGVFPFTGSSHFAMFGALMGELSRRGHQVDVIGVFPLEKPMPNYRDIDIRASKQSYLFNNMTYHEAMALRGLSINYLMKICGTDPCETLSHPNVQEVLRTKKGAYDVMVVELFLLDCYVPLGRHLNAPVVGITSLKAADWLLEPFGNSLNPSYIPSLYAKANQDMTFWQRVKNTLITYCLVAQVRYYMEKQLKYVEKHFGRRLGSMKELYNEVSVLLVNEHSSINDIRPKTPDIIEVGGLHVVDDEQKMTPDLQKWLDESIHGCVYFTFGSMVQIETFPEKTIKIFYEMFERIAPVRILLKIHNPEALLSGVPKNVKTLSWMPQVAVLKHHNVKLFITHGGLMGTQEAIVFKVPMVGIPMFVDQPTNMEMYVSKNIAIALDFNDITADSLTKAVKTVLNNPSYRENMKKMSKLYLDRPMSAMDTAIYWVEYTARHGTVLKSPAIELTWWQFHLLDVYGFFIMCFLVGLYIMKKIFDLLKTIMPSGASQVEYPHSKKQE